jgi:hypothetical protein
VLTRAGKERERIAVDCVEWLAALWELTEEPASASANPHLVALLRVEPRLLAHPARQLVISLRTSNTRDQLIKLLVMSAYIDVPGADEIVRAVQSFSRDAAIWCSPAVSDLIAWARADALDRSARIAGPLEAAADLAELVGERLPFRVVLGPSVFLPCPQVGRHGALVQLPSETLAHLHFGFPVHGGPYAFKFTRDWFVGGAWHYAIQSYLARRWPPVAQRIAARPQLMKALSRVFAVGASRRGHATITGQGVLDVLAIHVNFAMKCALCRRLGWPQGLHRALADAEGLVLFSWVEPWLLDGVDRNVKLPEYLLTLPDALAAVQAEWKDKRSVDRAVPFMAVNLAVASRSARSATFVLPDEWSDVASQAAVAGWRPLALPRLRVSDWNRRRTADINPVIAFGEPERNDLVRGVLEQRGLSLARVNARHPAIIALSEPGFDGRDWCLAVAVTRPETAAMLHIEMALTSTGPYIICDGRAVIALDS